MTHLRQYNLCYKILWYHLRKNKENQKYTNLVRKITFSFHVSRIFHHADYALEAKCFNCFRTKKTFSLFPTVLLSDVLEVSLAYQSSEDNTALGSLHWLFVFYLSKNFPSFNLALALWPSHFYSFILLILSFYFPSLIPFFFPFHKVNCVSHEGYNRLSRISLSIGSTPSTLNINLHVIVLLNVTFIRKMTCV